MDYKSSKDKLADNSKKVVVFIPAYVLKDDIKYFIYPPHSTLFYPKLPEGLVSFLQGLILKN
jgi:hypothetical protein